MREIVVRLDGWLSVAFAAKVDRDQEERNGLSYRETSRLRACADKGLKTQATSVCEGGRRYAIATLGTGRGA